MIVPEIARLVGGAAPRRDFLLASAELAAGAGLALTVAGCRDAAATARAAMRSGEALRVLADPERLLLEAIADRILPPDGDQPGAAGLGAAVFIDHYAADRPELLAALRGVLAGLEQRVRALHADAAGFAALEEPAAEGVLEALLREAPGDFGLLQMLVLAGAFGAPARGGNRDRAGWTLLGYDDRHAWQPPFGSYDRQADAPGGAG